MKNRMLLTGFTVVLGTLVSVPAFAQGWPGAHVTVSVPAPPLAVAVPPGPVALAVPPAPVALPVDPAVQPGRPSMGPFRPGWGAYGYRGPRPINDSALFVNRTRARLDEIGAHLRMQVAQQLLHRRAFAHFMYQRSVIEAQIAQAQADGFINFPERRAISMQVEQILQTVLQLRTDRSPRFGWR